jgi:acetyl-CoA acyltransferase
MRNAYIVSSVRTPVGKAPRGSLHQVRPEDMGATAVRGAIAQVEGLVSNDIEDVILGCAMPEAQQGFNLGRLVALRAGLPDTVPGATINRLCSSGLQAIASATQAIAWGQADVIVAGGVESMSLIPMGGHHFLPHPELLAEAPDTYITMGLTAENVAEQFQISRADQDTFALRSHQRALDAIAKGRFKKELVPISVQQTQRVAGSPVIYSPVEYPRKNQENVGAQALRPVKNVGQLTGLDISQHQWFEQDEGPRADTSLEALAALKPVFRQDGTVTAGNSSQMSDGAAATVIMSRDRAEHLGLHPLGRLIGFAVTGVAPEIMGIGPVTAIPKVLDQVDLTLKDIGLIELNEAFAAQAVAVIRKLGLNEEIVNVNGGAIALGHPLGCSGAKLTATLLHEMERRRVRYGLVTMCVGGGMGAAGVFESLW